MKHLAEELVVIRGWRWWV